MSKIIKKKIEELYALRSKEVEAPVLKPEDFWDWCDVLAVMNVTALEWFRDHSEGVPVTLTDASRSTAQEADDLQRWRDQLDVMIIGWKAVLVHNELHPQETEPVIQDGLLEFSIHVTSLWD